MNFRRSSVFNDLSKLSRGFTRLFGVERNMQITLSHENHTNTCSNESFRRKQTTKNVRSQGNQTATELKYVLLPIISNKEGREACVRALEYSKQTAKSTYQCHFVLYFVSASVDHPLTLWALWNTGLMVLSVKISRAAVSIWSGWESTEIFSVNLASNGDSI